MVKEKGEPSGGITKQSFENFHQPPFTSSPYEDDINPEDSVSVVSAFSSKDSEGSEFGNIEAFQV